MAVTEQSYTGNGSTTQYSFTFPYLKSTDVEVQVDAAVTTAWTFANATTVQFNTAPSDGAKIRILRKTNVDSLTATFYPGSAIKSEDLNDNFTQNLYSTQEKSNRAFETTGGTITGNVALGEDVIVTFEGATDNAHETTITVADPTADRTITLPNVTGTVVTTGDTATVTATMLAANSVDSSELVDASIDTSHIGDSQVTTAKIAADAVTGAKIADDQINSEHYIDGSIDTAHIADLNITTAKIAADAITGAKIADDVVDSEHLAADSIDTEHYAPGSVDATALASNSVTNAKMADDSVGADELIDSSIGTAALASNAVTLAKIADNAVGTSELVDTAVTTAKLANNAVTTAKITDSNVTTAKINNDAVTQDKLADDSVGTPQLIDASVNADRIASNAVTTAKILDDAVTSAKIAANAVTTTEIADAELTTLAGMQSGTASILAGGTTLTATLAEINTVVDGKSVETTISDTDAAYPTSGAVVDYVAAQLAPIGGLEVIATEVAFPNTQPSAGVVISIADAGGIVVNGSGTSTTGRTVGGTTVTINNIASNFNSSTIDAGVSFMVSSTGSGQIYNYHKATLKEADILNLSNDINDFGNRYRVASSAPSSSLDNGDLWYDTSNAKMMVYSTANSAWEEVTSTGDFYINTISSYSGTGGNSATFNGSAYRFVLSNPPTSAQQLVVSVNGVIQKPNSGTGQPSEGFALNGSSIVFSAAPATGADYFIITVGSTVAIGTPSDNTISTAKIQNLAVTGDKVATNLDLADNKKIRFGTGNDLEIYHSPDDSYIKNTTGDLRLLSDSNLILRSADQSENYIVATKDSDVELYYDGVNKLQTHPNGVLVNGNIYGVDNSKILLGASADLEIFHDGTHSRIKDTGTGGLYSSASIFKVTDAAVSENMLLATENGAVELYYDGVKKIETTSSGVSLASADAVTAGSFVSTNTSTAFTAVDGGVGYFGTGLDLRLYHDASHSWITNTTGDLILKCTGDDIALQSHDDISMYVQGASASGYENAIMAIGNGAVDLYYDNVKKLSTTAAGAWARGELRIFNYSGSKGLWVGRADSDVGTTPGVRVCADASKGFVIAYGGSLRFQIGAVDGTASNALIIDQATLDADFSGDINVVDNKKLLVGTGDDLKIYHDGTSSYIDNDTGWLNINTATGGIQINKDTSEYMGRFIVDGASELYYDNVKKFETSSLGVIIHHDGANAPVNALTLQNTGANTGGGSGIFLKTSSSTDDNRYGTRIHTLREASDNGASTLVISNENAGASALEEKLRITAAGLVRIPDNGKFTAGAGDDLQIYHDGTSSFITDDNLLVIRGDGLQLQRPNGNMYVKCIAGGSVELYHDNTKRFETAEKGVSVIGGGLNVKRDNSLYSGAIYFNGFSDTNHMLWNDHHNNPNSTRTNTDGFDGIKWNTYMGLQLFGKGNELETIAKFMADGACELYWNNNKKFETEAGGGKITGSLTETSDRALKKDIQPLSNSLTNLKQLNGYSFAWKDNDIKSLGLIAQEVETIYPDLVTGEEGDKGLKYSGLIAPLLEAVKELSAEVETLKTKVAALEAK